MPQKNLIVLVGPTGVGKTETSLKLAEYFRAPIINADSRQIYKGMTIGTAAPTEEDQRKPFLWRHFVNIPEAGNFLFLDSGWMKEMVQMRLFDCCDNREYATKIQAINTFERQLVMDTIRARIPKNMGAGELFEA